jgi:hypothetical protein
MYCNFPFLCFGLGQDAFFSFTPANCRMDADLPETNRPIKLIDTR